MEIWFNPRCSKCRLAVEAFDEAGVEYRLRRYLDDPPTAAELADVLGHAGLEPWEVVRTADAEALGLDLDIPRDRAHREQWVALLAANPAVLQRPLVVAPDGSAWVARTPDAVQQAVGHAREGSG
jgi:arsenate reductase